MKLPQDAKKGEKPTLEPCREAGCSTASFYTWKAKYGDATVDEARQLRQLERETPLRAWNAVFIGLPVQDASGRSSRSASKSMAGTLEGRHPRSRAFLTD